MIKRHNTLVQLYAFYFIGVSVMNLLFFFSFECNYKPFYLCYGDIHIVMQMVMTCLVNFSIRNSIDTSLLLAHVSETYMPLSFQLMSMKHITSLLLADANATYYLHPFCSCQLNILPPSLILETCPLDDISRATFTGKIL